jgi:hypothetical protein
VVLQHTDRSGVHLYNVHHILPSTGTRLLVRVTYEDILIHFFSYESLRKQRTLSIDFHGVLQLAIEPQDYASGPTSCDKTM